MLSDNATNPNNPGALLGQTASNAIPATGGTLTFFAAPQTLTPILLVAGQKYWLFCRGLANQVWGGVWDFAADNTLFGSFATGEGSLAFAEGTAHMPAFQVNMAQ
jgi:hypothetical protein